MYHWRDSTSLRERERLASPFDAPTALDGRAKSGRQISEEPQREVRWTPPDKYGLVEPQVYRSAFPTPASFDFLRLLNLRTVVNLSQEVPVRDVLSFFQENGITLDNVGLQVWTHQEIQPISHELIKEALQLVLDSRRHPLLLMSSSGTHQLGVLVGCLRRQQGWNLAACLDEYRSFAAPSARPQCEQFIELWETDLLTLPAALPAWFVHQQRMLAADAAAWEQLHGRGPSAQSGGAPATASRRPADAAPAAAESAVCAPAAAPAAGVPIGGSMAAPPPRQPSARSVVASDDEARGREYFRVHGLLASPGVETSMVDDDDD